jgi:hypothetical protein
MKARNEAITACSSSKIGYPGAVFSPRIKDGFPKIIAKV